MNWSSFIDRWKPKASTAPKRSGLTCECCGCRIHKRDRYRIVKAIHLDCKDPRVVGQTHLPE